jgi:hypothetical protein
LALKAAKTEKTRTKHQTYMSDGNFYQHKKYEIDLSFEWNFPPQPSKRETTILEVARAGGLLK